MIITRLQNDFLMLEGEEKAADSLATFCHHGYTPAASHAAAMKFGSKQETFTERLPPASFTIACEYLCLTFSAIGQAAFQQHTQ